MTKRVLVLGCGGSAGINFIECLRMAEEDIHIAGTDINRWHLELPRLDSRYVVPRCRDPSYLPVINDIIGEEGITLVHAQPDVEVENLSRVRDRVAAPTYLTSDPVIGVCQDKVRFNRALAEAGVPAPESYPVGDEEGFARDFGRLQGRSPKVWLRAVRGAGSRAALPVTRVDHALMWMDYWHQKEGIERTDFMISEFLPGTEYAFQSIWRDGELVCSAARKRLEYVFGNLMPSGQSSSPTVALTVHDGRLNDIVTRAVRAVDPEPRGIYCVDVKENSEGVPCVTEVNIGRFFTTSNFFASLGANMPYDYVRMAHGEEPLTHRPYDAVPEGMYWIRLMDKGPILMREGEWSSVVKDG